MQPGRCLRTLAAPRGNTVQELFLQTPTRVSPSLWSRWRGRVSLPYRAFQTHFFPNRRVRLALSWKRSSSAAIYAGESESFPPGEAALYGFFKRSRGTFATADAIETLEQGSFQGKLSCGVSPFLFPAGQGAFGTPSGLYSSGKGTFFPAPGLRLVLPLGFFGPPPAGFLLS